MRKVVLFINFFFAIGCLFGQQAKLMLPIGHTSWVNTAAFSPNGKRIVTASFDNTAKIWDALTGDLLADLKGHTGWVMCATFSPEGKRIVTASHDNTAKIWDAQSGTLSVSLKGHTGWVNMAAFSPDGKKVVTASLDNTARIWDVQTGASMIGLRGHSGNVVSAYFSPDGKKIITASADKTAKIWDAQTGTLLTDLKGHTDRINSAMFSPDGKKLVTASRDRTAKIWDAQTGYLLGNLVGHRRSVNISVFSPDGTQIATIGSDNTAKIWDAQTTMLLTDIKGDFSEVHSIAYSPDGRCVAIACGDHTAKIWDGKTGTLLANIKGHSDAVVYAAFSPDGKKIVTASLDHTAKIWDEQTGNLLVAPKEHTYDLNSAVFSPDGREIVTTSGDHTAKIWNGQTGTMMMSIKGHSYDVNCATFSPDKKKIVTASDDNTAKIWDAQTGALLVALKGHTNVVNTAFFSPDGEKIITASRDSTAKIWDAQTGALLADLMGHTDVVRSAIYSSDGKKIVTASADNTAKIWDGQTGTLIANIAGHTSGVNNAIFSPDGKRIVTASFDRTAKIWDGQTGAWLADLKGHKSGVYSATFSPDGKKIVTVSIDQTAKIWDSIADTLLVNLYGHTDIVRTANFSPDGNKILTASADNTAKLWDTENGRLLYTFFAVDSIDYLVTDPFGRYDGTENARKLLYFACGTEVIGLDQVKDQLWVPNLAERILKGDTINAKTLSDLNICGLTPIVEKQDRPGLHYSITARGGGLSETVLAINNIEVQHFGTSELAKTNTNYELNIDDRAIQPYLVSGQKNLVTVKAYTQKDNIASRGAEIIKDESSKPRITPNLYAVMIGISDYKGLTLKLNFAAKDAEDMSKAVAACAKKLLDTAGGKEHVFMYNLTSGKNHYDLPEKLAIKKVFNDIGRKATSNDILLIFFAGHGVIWGGMKQFYFLTADASQASATDAPDQVGISTKELSEWMQPSAIKAQKRILILDACNSGQALNELVKIGADGQNYATARNDDKAEQIKEIDKLNERSGLFILAASASNQSAYEMGRYSQGLLTYSLLKAIKQQPDILDNKKFLNVSRWFNASEKTVSDMVRETGKRQEPQIVSAGNFNIGVVDQDVMAVIKLAEEKPLFTASKFLNLAIEDDDIELSGLIDQKLNEISLRGGESQIIYTSASNSPDAWSLSGGYDIKGDEITIKVNVKQNKEIKTRLELAGKKSDLKSLAEKVVNDATDWILKKK